MKNKYNLLDYLKIIGYCVLKTDNEKTGEALENSIEYTLKGLSNCRIYRNVIIPIQGNSISTTELDLIAIYNNHIYIIEAKNYNGALYGNGEDYNWIVKYQNGREYNMYNPIKQQYGHMKNLARLLNIGENNIASIICFSNSSDLSGLNLNRQNKLDVINLYNLINCIEYKEKINMKFNRSSITPIQIDRINETCKYGRIKRAIHKYEMKKHFNK